MSQAMLQAIGLCRVYPMGREVITALDSIDLAIEQGEFVAIMGPSGCGKSTLLNLLGGLDRPTAGRVLVEGYDLATFAEESLAALRRDKLGFIFQRHDLFPVLTARENVEFPLLLDNQPAPRRRSRTDELLGQIGLSAQAEHLPDELSGGQQQRVGIARALANNPRILLADEPTGNLDSATAGEIMDLLTGLVRSRGLTLITVTHDPATAARADRIVRLQDGRLV
jgi:putative ABC transport system ATP-binding protein